MDFRFTEEEEAFRKEVRDFIQEVLQEVLPSDWQGVDPGPEEEAREEVYQLAVEIWRKLAAKGWIGLGWPKEYGGQEDLAKDWILKEELIYRGVPGMDMAVVQGDLILQFGTEEQKRRFIPPIAHGEVKYAIGMSEPNVGSELFALQLRAVEEADCFVLNGQKTWTTGFQHADWCVLYARTDPNAPKKSLGISVFLIDPKSPGITMRQITQMTGLAPFYEVFYDNVRVPKENLLGEKNGGRAIAMYAFGIERSYGLVVLHNARRYFEQLVQYCKETYTNGQPLAKDPVIRNRLAEMAIEIEVGRNLGDRLNWMTSQEILTVLPSCQIKVHGANVAQRVASLGMQILGPYGQLDEKSKWAKLGGRMKHTYLSSVALSMAGGTSEISRNIIAGRFGLGLPS
ncbi:MAG: acyl-CoA dehydrogenase family protein [Dehalococcoidia bacterium]|nr:acyl-CoA dehydrogenase family protein [Dehalococcoidia bacterium]